MIVDITNEVLTRLITDFPTYTVASEYPSITPDFPMITVAELSNVGDIATKDTGGFNYEIISLDINIFTNGSNRQSKAKEIRNEIDSILSDEYGMLRDFGGQTPNADTDIFRYTLRYTARVDANRTIYRG